MRHRLRNGAIRAENIEDRSSISAHHQAPAWQAWGAGVMPISAERMKFYPGGSIRSPQWLAIRERIRERAGDACEGSPSYPDCRAENGRPHPVTCSLVVCTVAHFNHDLADSSDENLKFWCQ